MANQHPRPRTRFKFKAPHRTPRPLTRPPKAPDLSAEAEDESPPPPSSAAIPDPITKEEQEEESFTTALLASLTSPEQASHYSAIFGAPIHIYPRPLSPGSGLPVSDAEYSLHVQGKLYAQTRPGMEERARRVRERREREERAQRDRRRRERVERRVRERDDAAAERAFRNAKIDAERAFWQQRVREYEDSWTAGGGQDVPFFCDDGVTPEQAEGFLRKVAEVRGLGIGDVLRVERVRWHPDKIMQRFRVDGLDAGGEVMRRVNEVWRAVEAIWQRLKVEEGKGV